MTDSKRPANGSGGARRLVRHGALAALVVTAIAFFPGVQERTASAQGTAGDAAAGKAKTAVCAACHGPAGISINPAWPSLAGQQPVYLANQIRLFRDGVRVEPTMQPFVQNLTDQDIDDIAAYYASLSPCP